MFLHPKIQTSIFCGSTVLFVSVLVRNPKDRFSRDKVHFVLLFHAKLKYYKIVCEESSYSFRSQIIILYMYHDQRNMIFEPHHEKTGFLHMRKQRRTSAAQ